MLFTCYECVSSIGNRMQMWHRIEIQYFGRITIPTMTMIINALQLWQRMWKYRSIRVIFPLTRKWYTTYCGLHLSKIWSNFDKYGRWLHHVCVIGPWRYFYGWDIVQQTVWVGRRLWSWLKGFKHGACSRLFLLPGRCNQFYAQNTFGWEQN